eukprot:599595-Amphidinium_carterae.1
MRRATPWLICKRHGSQDMRLNHFPRLTVKKWHKTALGVSAGWLHVFARACQAGIKGLLDLKASIDVMDNS